MRWQTIAAGGIMLAVFAAAAFPFGVLAQSNPSTTGIAGGEPTVFFPVKIFEFQPVIDGAHVMHDFVVQNKGSVPLLVNNVRTG